MNECMHMNVQICANIYSHHTRRGCFVCIFMCMRVCMHACVYACATRFSCVALQEADSWSIGGSTPRWDT